MGLFVAIEQSYTIELVSDPILVVLTNWYASRVCYDNGFNDKVAQNTFILLQPLTNASIAVCNYHKKDLILIYVDQAGQASTETPKSDTGKPGGRSKDTAPGVSGL